MSVTRFPKKCHGDITAQVNQFRDLFLDIRTWADAKAAMEAAEAFGRASIAIHKAVLEHSQRCLPCHGERP